MGIVQPDGYQLKLCQMLLDFKMNNSYFIGLAFIHCNTTPNKFNCLQGLNINVNMNLSTSKPRSQAQHQTKKGKRGIVKLRVRVRVNINIKRQTSKLDPEVGSVMGWPTTHHHHPGNFF